MMHDRKQVPARERQGEPVKTGLIDLAQPSAESATAQLLSWAFWLGMILVPHRCWLRRR